MSDRDPPSAFRGEDENADFASPVMDLAASAVLAAVAVWIMVESLRLPVPGGLFTAPGLLPFAASASLLLMTLTLAAGALRRRRQSGAGRFEMPDDLGRGILLGAIVVLYVTAIQVLPVAWSGTVAGMRLAIGAFEIASVIVLTGVLRLFWRQALWLCFSVSLGWIAVLSIVFRGVFSIPLP